MKIEYYLFNKMSDGFEDLIWNGNSVFSYIKWLFRTKNRKNRTSTVLVCGLWRPRHLTAIKINMDLSK